ncbi:DNA-3-methyladenine glycosylase [Yersinia aleksiciae]|uniref:DNA-3-methyladenine glycosylase family protein n=1 Tax=Yersinia aleksiciae TaxID=263819 RepID=UPI0025AAD347|nr:DNA-3-methyladenine glycosylase [Yersinia aleksiciae]MDN0124154.1 DNA-3-methyladenine glycosylase [Yersinia aleksiciae]
MFYSYGETEINHLKRRDKKMAAAIDRLGMIARPLSPDLFAALIRNIVDQQISVKAALTVNARLVTLLGTITPFTVAQASAEAIQGCGMTMRKAGYIKGAADAALNGSLDLSAIAQLPDNDVITQLSSLNGVGVWTAEMLLISSLCRPDVLSWGDLAIRRGMMNLYRHKTLPRERFEKYRHRYAPYGTTASLYLWALSHQTE